jgi:hypothetical protein
LDDVAQALAREKLRIQLKAAKPKRELAWNEIQSGVNPAYVAMKYGYPIDEMERAAATFRARQEKVKREHTDAA